MGNSFTCSIDYFDIINDQIKNILYPYPNTSKHKIKQLNELFGTKLFYIENLNLKIKTCVCEITPKNFQINKCKNIIIFAHGNGCDIYTFYSYLKHLSEKLNSIVVSFDYPEYGLSTGELNEFTCYNSLTDVINHYLKYNKNNILLVGQSLGTGVIIDYVSKNNWISPIILISPYKSIPKIISNYDIIENTIIKNKFASYQKIKFAKCPIKIFHGIDDNLIDISHGIELYELVSNKMLKPQWIENCSHNDILNYIKINDYKKILYLINNLDITNNQQPIQNKN